jgi:hypothetical protein
MERAAKLRESQTETVDATQLVREARNELSERTERWKEDEGRETNRGGLTFRMKGGRSGFLQKLNRQSA